tara:strand:+ start:2732 stop:3001 length:270 start_codon:yes stop_codon:yes gene_type:complete
MRDTLLRAAHGYSYATSNFWRATRGDDTLFITGTNQLNGPRHNAVMQTLLPLLTGVRTLLAEAGPAEEVSLRRKKKRHCAEKWLQTPIP